MNNGIMALEIFPEHDNVFMYGAPDKDSTYRVAGKLRLILSRPLKVKQVSIKLKGKSEYSDWINQFSALNLLKLDHVICQKRLLPRGVIDLDYEFHVGGNLPQTYVTSFGFIRYKLVAVVQPSSLLLKDEETDLSISFQRHYLPCNRDLLPAPPTKVYRGERKDILKYEIDIPTIVGEKEKGMLVRIRLLPMCDQGRVKKIKFDLVQLENYRVLPDQQELQEFGIDASHIDATVQLNRSSPPTKKKRTHPIKPTSLTISRDEDAWNNPLTYNLPFVQGRNGTEKNRLRSTIKSPLISVRHRLQIIMSFEDETEKKLDLPFPLIVTSIPDGASLNGAARFDSGLPSYDDVMRNSNSEENPSVEVSDDSRRSANADISESDIGESTNSIPLPFSVSNSRSSTPQSTTNDHPSYSPFDSQITSSSQEQIGEEMPTPTLRHKRSQLLAQTFNRLLSRPYQTTSRPNSPSPSSNDSDSSIPSVKKPITSTSPVNKNKCPQLNAIQTTTQSIDLFGSSSHTDESLTHPGRLGWHLNIVNDDNSQIISEIHSAPSSPRQLIPNFSPKFDTISDSEGLNYHSDNDSKIRRETFRISASFDAVIVNTVDSADFVSTLNKRRSPIVTGFSRILRRGSSQYSC
ncbi:hypothetical protein G9A89_008554 [Geosiphon pyriformis]|nr:hypothetical protein G9A89_008554 [Geosiphon pyriformis]